MTANDRAERRCRPGLVATCAAISSVECVPLHDAGAWRSTVSPCGPRVSFARSTSAPQRSFASSASDSGQVTLPPSPSPPKFDGVQNRGVLGSLHTPYGVMCVK